MGLIANRFVRRFGACFAKLTGLYVLYAAWTFFSHFEVAPYMERIVLLGGFTSFALAVLAAPAAFSAAVNHFDLFGESEQASRKRDWAWLGAIGLGACLLTELGIPLSDYVLRRFDLGIVHEWPGIDYVRLLVPVAVGMFVVIAGVAGAAVGHATQWSSRLRRHAGCWLAGMALMLLFAVSLNVFAGLVRMYGYPAVLIVCGGPLLPLLATALLVRSQGYGVLEVVGLDRSARWLDVETVNRLVDAVVREDEEGEPSIESAARNETELEVARFLQRLRRTAAPATAVSTDEARETVAKALERARAQVVPTTSPTPSPQAAAGLWKWTPDQVGELGVSWALLSTGLLGVGLAGGLPPNLGAALAVGLLGAAIHAHLSRRGSTSTTAPSPA